MNTTHVESVSFLSVTEHTTDKPIPDEWFSKPPLLFLEKVGWQTFIWGHNHLDRANFTISRMTDACAEGCVTISRNGECGYTVRVEVNR